MGRKLSVLLALVLTLLGITVFAQNPNAPRRPVVGRRSGQRGAARLR